MLVYVWPPKTCSRMPIFSERAGIVSTARIEGPLLYRGASASIETVPAFSLPTLLRARVPGAQDQRECPSPPFYREGSSGTMDSFSSSFPLFRLPGLGGSGQGCPRLHASNVIHAHSKLACSFFRDGG